MSVSGSYLPVPPSQRVPVRRRVETPVGAARFMGGALALLWLIELADVLSGNLLDYLAIRAQDPQGLVFILTAPFLHFGWQHLISNSVPFFVFGWLVLMSGLNRWLVTTAISILVSGLLAWALTPAGAYIAGASGLIFGWFAYLLVRGLWTRDWRQILIAVALVVVYGGMIWGVLPTQAGVSWQAHLGGAIGGVISARVTARRN